MLPARGGVSTEIAAWFESLIALFLPAVDQLDQLPAKASFIFRFDAEAARGNEENAAVLATEIAEKVLVAFAERVAACRKCNSRAIQGLDE